MNKILVDADILVAIFDETDVWHASAHQLLVDCERQHIQCIVLDCVIDESISVLIRRLSNKKKIGELETYLSRVSEKINSKEIRPTSSIIKKQFQEILSLLGQQRGGVEFYRRADCIIHAG